MLLVTSEIKVDLAHKILLAAFVGPAQQEVDRRMTVEQQWNDFDHLSAAGLEDPHSFFRDVRGQCPIGHSAKHGGFWTITGFQDVNEAARDAQTFSSRQPGPGFPIFQGGPPMIANDPPLHREFRAPLSKLFSPASAEKMREVVRAIITELIDGFIADGKADLAAQLCTPLPAIVTFALLDLPESAREDLPRWNAQLLAEGPSSAGAGHVGAMVHDLYDVRTASPGDDIASQVLGFKIDGRPISREEWEGLIVLLIMAGLDTTSNGGALILKYLSDNLEVRRFIKDNPDQLRPAIEELLRLATPVPQHSRGVTHDVEIGGIEFHQGEVVLLSWIAANRDPECFSDPDTFSLDRPSNRHVAFGAGTHRCLGTHLAKVELQVLVEEVLERLPDYHVIDEEVEHVPGLNRGMTRLGAVFTAGARSDEGNATA
ncbi:cytochrome P450 [Gordonia sp. ABSL11-1]|uniref:cytochrome P450 n=1 Tax=Gordonia sp. ABSL11-1 TaxID=3053924 RepID=UPI002573CA3E|nr:cytochrome P450 [Gordonia sp. ABSL11-1]MDL9948590.1 cytochrome P450 [Gordonia sp. ABSL11-1]